MAVNFDVAHYAVTTLAAVPSFNPTIVYIIDGAMSQPIAVTGTSVVVSVPTTTTSHTLEVYLNSTSTISGDNWGSSSIAPNNSLRITGFTEDAYSSDTAGVFGPKGWVVFDGDSITNGFEAGGGSTIDHRYSWTFSCGRQLLANGYEYCVRANNGSGLLLGGILRGVPKYSVSGGVYNAANSSWYLIDAAHSVLDSNNQISAYGQVNTVPAAWYSNVGTNEALNSQSGADFQTANQGYMTALRGAAPGMKIFLGMPFCLEAPAYPSAYSLAIQNGYAAYVSASADTNCKLFDFGLPFASLMYNAIYLNGDMVHLSPAGNTMAAGEWLGRALPLLSSSPSGGGNTQNGNTHF
jgi:hypothetical protein